MNSKTATLFFGALLILCGTALESSAQTKRVDVKFPAGAIGATYSNTVTGYGFVDYYVRARGGQRMSVKLTTRNPSMYFFVARSGSEEAISDDARDQTDWTGALPDDGTYVVRVYLFRNEARRNRRPVNFRIRFNIT